MTAPSDSLVEFTDLLRGFGRVPVLAGVSGQARTGQVLLVTGSNGSGKSTLLRCLAGLLRPQAGTIRLREDGRELDAVERRRRVGYVAPDLAFYEPLTAEENLTFFCRLRGVPARRAVELLATLGVPARRAAGALSSGMRQRLRWAWALLHQPRLLLLDEPFQNLDEAGEAAVRTLLDSHLEDGLAVIATPSPLLVPRLAATLDLSRHHAASDRPTAGRAGTA
ncbi:MAG TPA: ATP-binding cassette domain-containing protein [Thermoanaerobaculia bacterium]|nr:ATP-binding cassette domain-containing protein [Thermoanaerobaculia bacterium]